VLCGTPLAISQYFRSRIRKHSGDGGSRNRSLTTSATTHRKIAHGHLECHYVRSQGFRVKGAAMVLLEFSMTPLGKGESVSTYVARSLEIVEASGLDYRLHAMGTVIEGEWDQVFGVVRKCYEAMSADCDRITCSIKVDARKGASGRLSSKVKSVEEKLGRTLKSTESS
jgi:uncharacterized protein (TIGR00106 family)